MQEKSEVNNIQDWKDGKVTLEELHRRAYANLDKSDNYNYDFEDEFDDNSEEDSFFNLMSYSKANSGR